ncbi:fungal-specific transcription factor domain-containing protein [Exophiala viscosa]|uniref:Fungal-specific transcription factor domain-containing protein n=1 Tax=Exophiala viscosa TaxID=2486360 RepID=A0AAN6DV10_9EURO|nr:fungal-specific transcription factor domain-containing protein [Exophiala viscosa]KAI1625780.1 fungal-specific transcription factor domain-containing protein [Exophiala viscosa]
MPRSRAGCINCRRAKVKCHEERPYCTTCARRGHTCEGYTTKLRWRKTASPESIRCSSSTTFQANSKELPRSPKESHLLFTPLHRSPDAIPDGIVPPEDVTAVQAWFSRHPREMVVSSHFVDEMNANVLTVLQLHPDAIRDTIVAIGQLYLDRLGCGSFISALSRRQRTLARLRTMEDPLRNLELALCMFVQLAGLEIVDMKTSPGEVGLSGILSCAAILVDRFFLQDRHPSHIAKYFLRALARQDMIMSLTYQRRPWIRTSTWLDEECLSSPDRFMGWTTTLMPLLEELCELAEDTRLELLPEDDDEQEKDGVSTTFFRHEQAVNLQLRIENWQPVVTDNIPAASRPTLLAHATALQLASLLYLFRIIYPAGSLLGCDQQASEMGRTVLSTLGVVPEKLKTMLWPALVAACEMCQTEDRAVALNVFDGIYTSRATATALAVKAFCVERVWQARDTGQDWDWMKLIYRYPGECTPI